MLKKKNKWMFLAFSLLCLFGVLSSLNSYGSESLDADVCFNDDCWKHIKMMRGFGTDIVIGDKSCPIDDLDQCSDEIDELNAKQLSKLFSFIYKHVSQNSTKKYSGIKNFQTKNYLLHLFYMSYILDTLNNTTVKAFERYSALHFAENPWQALIRNFSSPHSKKNAHVFEFIPNAPGASSFYLLTVASHTSALSKASFSGGPMQNIAQFKRAIVTKHIHSIRSKINEFAKNILQEFPESDMDLELGARVRLAYDYIDLEVKKYFVKNFHAWWNEFYEYEIQILKDDKQIRFGEVEFKDWDPSEVQSDFSRVIWNRLLELKTSL